MGRSTPYASGPSPRPGVRRSIREAPKIVTSRLHQLVSGHAVTAVFLKNDHRQVLAGRLRSVPLRCAPHARRLAWKGGRGFGFHVRQARARPSNTTRAGKRYSEAVEVSEGYGQEGRPQQQKPHLFFPCFCFSFVLHPRWGWADTIGPSVLGFHFSLLCFHKS